MPGPVLSPKKRLFSAALTAAIEKWPTPTLKTLPAIAYWRHGCGLKLTTATLLYHFQLQMQNSSILDGEGKRWSVKHAYEWQVDTGISVDEWDGALAGAVGYIVNQVALLGSKTRVWLRPTAGFLEMFGVTLSDYDTVGKLEQHRRAGRPPKGQTAPKLTPYTPEEHAAVDRWLAAGGKHKLKGVI